MLNNIKSLYFLIKLFSYVDEKNKLEIIKCNKSLQKNMNVSIINYQHFSRKYLIYEPNGIGKEYYGIGHTLAYEGGYLNGKRNGKGKEYSWCWVKLIFEGEYLNGKRNGKGKEYDKEGREGRLKYEGEYLNGKRNGKGKEYDWKGNIIFEGEYFNNKILNQNIS